MSPGEADLSRTLQILVVGPGPELGEELEAACRAATDARVSLRVAAGFGEAVEAVRGRAPDLVCVELGSDAGALRELVSSLRVLIPDLPLLGIRDVSREGGDPSEVLVEALRAGFVDVLDRPLSSNDLRRVLPRVSRSARTREDVGRIAVFHSTKGGVGKSTLSVNVACGLARRRPERVLLIDASLQLGVCAAALDLAARPTLADASRERDRLDETLLRQLAQPHSCGLRVLAAPYGPVDAADVSDESLARILAIGRRAFDFVVVDTLPLIDGAMLTLLDFADRAYLVNQGTVPDVIGAARLLETLDELGIGDERRRIVLNRNLPRFAGSLASSEVGDRLGREIDYEVPHSKKVLTALNLGQPLILRAAGRFGWGRAVRRIVDDVESLARGGPPGGEAVRARAEDPGGAWVAEPAEAAS